MTKTNVFKSLPIVAAAWGRKFGVSIRVGGSDAFTDGKTITLPGIVTTDIPENVIYGYLAHESGHVSYTDWNECRPCLQAGSAQKSLFNIIEDGRIEERLKNDWPGIGCYLDDLIRSVYVDGEEESFASRPADPNDPLGAFLSYVFLRMRCELNGYRSMFRRTDLDALKDCRRLFGDALMNDVDSLIMKRLPLLKETKDAVRLTNDILKILRKSENAGDEDEPQKGGEENGKAAPQGSGSGSASGSSASGESGSSESQGERSSQSCGSGRDDEADSDKTSDKEGGKEEGGNSSKSGKKTDGAGDDKSEGAGGSGKSEKSEASDKSEKSGKSGQSGKSDGSDGEAQSDEKESAGANGRSASDRPQQSGTKSSSGEGSQSSGNAGESGESEEGADAPSDGASNGAGKTPGGKSRSERIRRILSESADGTDERFDVTASVRRTLKAEAGGGENVSSEYPTFSVTDEPPVLKDMYGSDKPETALCSRADSLVSGIRRRLMRLVESTTQRNQRRSESGRRISRNMLARTCCGETRVFLKREEHHSPNTAFHILVDFSTSMSGNSRENAIIAAAATYKSLLAVKGVKPAVSVFPSPGNGKPYGRVFTHEHRASDADIRALSAVQAWGGTPLPEALVMALSDIRRVRGVERNVILVITDGWLTPKQKQAIAKIRELCDKSSVETLGIYIDQDPPGLFNSEERIDDVSTLPDVMFRLSEESLTTHIS